MWHKDGLVSHNVFNLMLCCTSHWNLCCAQHV